MNELDFSFEPTAWDLTLAKIPNGGSLSAARFLTLTENEDEDGVQSALAELERRHIALDITGLPVLPDAGAMAVRLRREAELVKQENFADALEQNDPLRLHLQELAAIPACGDEQLLAEACAAGEEASREALMHVSLHRVLETARELAGRGVLLLDLIQEGSLGLWQAIADYHGGDFESYSLWWIRQSMAKLITLQARADGIGQRLRRSLENYCAADEKLLAELGRNPTREEVANAIHIPLEEAECLERMLADIRTLALSEKAAQPVQDDAEEQQAIEDTAYFRMRARIADMLSVLPENEAEVLRLRFGLEDGLPLSPEDTGKRLSLTPEEVLARESAALTKLRG